MHPEALDFCERATRDLTPGYVIEVGSRNINGTARDVIPHKTWWGLDIEDGPGVDEVRDLLLTPYPFDGIWDLAVCTEVLEHVYLTAHAIGCIVDLVQPGGHVLVTCATEGRAPHSAVDGGPLRVDEHYANVLPCELERAALTPVLTEVHPDRGDLYYLGRVNG